ncbi:PREDICTED: 5'(3')-deoxyribonucleotidase, mitochondrial-like [Thamnophis sirtalis]|uniref:5'(3')-deoxyribonucleotidase, mitochondrial-like n=1 Tax=Thamnophis sirtalis TaxID=35019 RepID=A0A6I9YCK6_9SAUR|nr:PREDICTED: 5'(3')-deoxyribonucleotidase, mitochondrial-like [Thamnophis sirtalis]
MGDYMAAIINGRPLPRVWISIRGLVGGCFRGRKCEKRMAGEMDLLDSMHFETRGQCLETHGIQGIHACAGVFASVCMFLSLSPHPPPTTLQEKAISIWESKDFFMELDPLPGAVEAVKEMAGLEGTEVFICTSPIKKYRYCAYEKFAWIEKHFGHEFLEHLILTRDKTIVSGHMLIDDRPDIVGAERSPTWEHVLFTACHNKHLQLPSSCHRLHSWADDWKAILESKRAC